MKNLFISPILSIIIVSYNCKDFLVEAIRSVKQFVDLSYEIIVVDNASSDDTTATIPVLFPDITFIANTTNNGFSHANNQGAAVATGNYILLLNPDARLINNDWKKALAYLEKHPKSILGPRILNPDLSLQDSVFYPPSFTGILKEIFFITHLQRDDLKKIVAGGDYALSGACLLMLRANYELIGGFDVNLFWMDDVDLCHRARQAGLSVVYFEEWEIVHVIGQSSKKNYIVSISNQLLSKLKFFKKHRQYFNFYVSLVLIEMQILTRAVLFLMTSLFGRIYFQKFKAYCYTQLLLIRYIFTGKTSTF